MAGMVLALDNLKIHGNPVVAPLEHHHHNRPPKDIGALFVQAPFLGQRIFLAGFAFERAIDHQITHPVFQRW
jgi:hypothetical protein